ncbi:MAG: adenylate kinase [Candidatus Omnitrophota bacterium]|jgi:adenylate kinase
MRLIILGSPGVGKGTQAKALAEHLKLLHICSGDLLRQAVKEGTDLGKNAKGFMDKGELVPDNLVIQLIMQRISQPDAKNGFILDGYPRNIHQATELDKQLGVNQLQIDAVIALQASQEVIISRLTGRRLCSKCQANFHIKNMPPKEEGICDYCGGRLYQRVDDNQETIKNRLKVYQHTADALIDYYKHKNKLVQITANEEADVVLKKMIEGLDGYLKDSS